MRSDEMNKPSEKFSSQHMYSVFARQVRERLQPLIKGHVYCYVINDVLYVDIHSLNGYCFRYNEDNIAYKILCGMVSETVSRTAHKKYEKYIKNLYFF